jgi:hypothetical protein
LEDNGCDWNTHSSSGNKDKKCQTGALLERFAVKHVVVAVVTSKVLASLSHKCAASNLSIV